MLIPEAHSPHLTVPGHSASRHFLSFKLLSPKQSTCLLLAGCTAGRMRQSRSERTPRRRRLCGRDHRSERKVGGPRWRQKAARKFRVFTFRRSEFWRVAGMVHCSCVLLRKVCDRCLSGWRCPWPPPPGAGMLLPFLPTFWRPLSCFYATIVFPSPLLESGLACEGWEGCLRGMVRTVVWGGFEILLRNRVHVGWRAGVPACRSDSQDGIRGV